MRMHEEQEPEVRYRFGPLERRGLIAGWRGGQIAVVAGGLVLAVLLLRARPGVPGGLAAFGLLAVAAAVACWPVAGRTAEQWFPTLLRWALRERSAADGVPVSLRDVDILAIAPGPVRVLGPRGAGSAVVGGQALGVVRDRRAGTCTAVLAISGHSFALLDPTEKERRIRGWAAMLAALTRDGCGVHRLQWLSMSRPDDGGGVRDYLRVNGVLPDAHRAWQSYAALVTGSEATTSRHEVFVAVQVRLRAARGRPTRGWAARGSSVGGAARSSAAPSAAAWRPGQATRAACMALRREVAGVARLLAEADADVDGALGPGDLARLARVACQPSAVGPVAIGSAGVAVGRARPWPAPRRTEERWDRVRTDATWHATYWVAEWPRTDVGAEFLAPLLLGSVRRTVSVVLEPVGPSRAARQVEQARTSEVADAELRRRGGFLATARRARESEALRRREAELAEGHGSYRLSGYVTVTAPSADELDEACTRTEHAAGQARLELRRLWGDQERALTCALPLCRGLA